jgi:hypothetical protein
MATDSEINVSTPEVSGHPIPILRPIRVIEQKVFSAGQIALRVSIGALIALCLLIAFQIAAPLFFAGKRFSTLLIDLPYDFANTHLSLYILATYAPHILLFVIIVLSGLVGYRLVVASGANPAVVIPEQDYGLLQPLITNANSDAIDQYVRLSSLSGFTGTFTQLGLTGLPLATIFMTLFFTCLTIYSPAIFLDLTKLTLGAFLGSFVQRQVEQRRSALDSKTDKKADKSDEAISPAGSA